MPHAAGSGSGGDRHLRRADGEALPRVHRLPHRRSMRRPVEGHCAEGGGIG
eukprot:gene8788-biopygen15195